MATLESRIGELIKKYLVPIERIWQPSDFLPDPKSDGFFDQITELRECSKELGYDFWIVLIGDMMTEEALPSYESWLMDVEGVSQVERNGWSQWVRQWTAEENRHGDVLNKFLYLSGRCNMREIEISIQYLLNDGFVIGTDRDPYKNFVYTSFQELATHVSHKNVAAIANKSGSKLLGKMCKIIAGDEMRHYLAYREFVTLIFEIDPNQMMLAFADMMKKKIVMPAHFLRESGEAIGSAFEEFSLAAQRIGVYTSEDYVDIMQRLIDHWGIGSMSGLSEEAEKARDYLMKLPARMLRVAERFKIPETVTHFKWVDANGVM
jgi:acyl-[acyl-carrier-protein] desaturase